MIRVKMLTNYYFSPDGVSTRHLDNGEVYDLPKELSDSLIAQGLAEPVKKSTKES